MIYKNLSSLDNFFIKLKEEIPELERLKIEDVEISNPAPIEDPSVYPECNTVVNIKALTKDIGEVENTIILDNSPFVINEGNFYYNRLDIETLLKGNKVVASLNENTNFEDVFKHFYERFGLGLWDFEVLEKWDVAEDFSEVVYYISPTHYTYTGKLVVKQREDVIDLNEVLKNKSALWFKYPNEDTTLIQGAIYSYPLDFTLYISDINVENPDKETLANVLKEVTGDDWSLDSESDYSLFGCVIETLNEENRKDKHINSDFSNGLLVTLSPEFSKKVGGYIVLNYN